MRLISFSDPVGRRSYGCLDGDEVIDLGSPALSAAIASATGAGSGPRTLAELVGYGAAGIEAARRAAEAAGTVDRLAAGDIRLLAPIPEPVSVFAIGRNYADHLAESGGDAPSLPRIFPKYRSTVIGPGEAIVKPALTQNLDWEVELAVVMGRDARDVSEQDALDYVAGYTIINDVSARDIQFSKPEQLVLAKNFRTFCPMGPWLVTSDEIADPGKLGIRSYVNGELMQNSSTANMIFSTERLISFLSSVTPLAAGDIISTGTPDGVGAFRTPPVWLRAGDEVRLEIDSIGELTNPVSDV